MPKAGAGCPDPKVGAEFCAGEAPVKLKDGAEPEPDAPPNMGVELPLLAGALPKAGAELPLEAPPNGKEPEPLV